MQNNSEGTAAQSALRLKTIFQLPGGLSDPAEIKKLLRSRYGLGDRRTIDEAIEFSGIDTRNAKMVGNKCGKLEYVPWTEHPKGPYHVPQFDATEDPLEPPSPGSIYFDNDDLFGRPVGMNSNAVGGDAPDLRALMNGLQSEEYEQRQDPDNEKKIPTKDTDDARFRESNAKYHAEAADVRPEAAETPEQNVPPPPPQTAVESSPEHNEPEAAASDQKQKLRAVPPIPELRQLNEAFGIHDDFVRVEEKVITAVEYYYHDKTNRSLIGIVAVLCLVLVALTRSGLCGSGKTMKEQRESLLYGGVKSV